jgi:hypothetical protein
MCVNVKQKTTILWRFNSLYHTISQMVLELSGKSDRSPVFYVEFDGENVFCYIKKTQYLFSKYCVLGLNAFQTLLPERIRNLTLLFYQPVSRFGVCIRNDFKDVDTIGFIDFQVESV